MLSSKRSLSVWALGAVALCAAAAASAQDTGNTVIGPPQLRDFSIQPKQRIVTQPPPQAQPAAPATTPPASTEPRAEAPRREIAPARVATAPRQAPAPTASSPPTMSTAPADPIAMPPVDATPAAPAPAVPETAPVAAAPAAEAEGTSYWYYALPVGMLALLGVAVVRRRRRNGAEAIAPAPSAAPMAATSPRPRPDPIPRPWLELNLKAERASFTDTEAELLFELEIANKGGSDARNLRIDVKMFNGGAEQDREIGAFFKTAGRETTKLSLPVAEAGLVGVIHGRVTLAREEMKAVRLDERLLFIPVVAVNALYDWGEGRTGQTSRSYVIGRELEQPSEKMGAFRVDQGPRVWRTVGQREHKLAKRV